MGVTVAHRRRGGTWGHIVAGHRVATPGPPTPFNVYSSYVGGPGVLSFPTPGVPQPPSPRVGPRRRTAGPRRTVKGGMTDQRLIQPLTPSPYRKLSVLFPSGRDPGGWSPTTFETSSTRVWVTTVQGSLWGPCVSSSGGGHSRGFGVDISDVSGVGDCLNRDGIKLNPHPFSCLFYFYN